MSESKAWMTSHHNTVEFENIDDVLSISIFLNETVLEDGRYEYDYHHFFCNADDVSIDDVVAHPEKYMSYGDPVDLAKENKELKTQVEALNESLSFMEECIVEMAEAVYQ